MTKKTRSVAMSTRPSSDELSKLGVWGDVNDARFREYVAREHVDDGMPVVELHRNHAIPLSAVRRWITTYREEGREGLVAAARVESERAKKRDASLAAKKLAPEEQAKLTAMIETRDLATKRAAYAIIRKRKLSALGPAVLDAIRWADAQKEAWPIQDELEVLSAIKAKNELHTLVTSKMRILSGYSSWFESVFRKAGFETKTVERPWSQHYLHRGEWYRFPK